MKLEELQPFCSRDETRRHITEPFVIDGQTYATDNRILIRVPGIIEGACEEGGPPGAAEVIPDDLTGYVPVEYPPGWEEFQSARPECEQCEGSGRMRECPDCHGDGEKECGECGRSEDCERCVGVGEIPSSGKDGDSECDACDGAGNYDAPFWVSLNRGLCAADLQYLRLAHTLPGARLMCKDAKAPLRIDFDGGEGALMPGAGKQDRGVPISDQWTEPATESE